MALDTSLISYYKLDESSGNATDSVGSNTLTNNNSVTYSTGKINNGANFVRASSQYLSKVDDTSLDLSANMSVSFWLNLSSLPGTNETQGLVTKDNTYGIYYQDSAGTKRFGMFSVLSSSYTFHTFNTTLSTSTFYHVTWTKSGTTSSLYINGILVSSGSATATMDNTTGSFFLGLGDGAGEYLNGQLDEVAIWSRALSADEVSQIFNSGRGNSYPFTATPPLYGGVAYYKLDETTGNAVDSIGGNTATNTNVTYAAGKINNGAVFNGSSAKLAIGSTSTLQLTTAVSIASWFKMSSSSAGIIYSKDSEALGGYLGYGIYANIPSTGNLRMRVRTGSGATFSDLDTTGKSYNDNTFHLVVAVYNAGVQKVYVDGTLVSTGGSGSSIYWATPQVPNIGVSSISDNWFNGLIDETSIFSRELSQTEITALYNSGLGNQYPFSFTPSLTTDVITNLDIDSVTVNGTVISDNGATVSERGFVYSNTTNPTIVTGTKVIVAGTIGSYSSDITGLLKNNTYYLKAYATNSFGTAYGAEVIFTTLGLDADTFYKNINGIEGQTYSVSCNVTGTTGTVTVKLGTTGTSQVINAGAGITTFQGTYGGLTGLIFEKSDLFDGTVDDVMWVLITGSAILDWTLNSLTNIFPINSAVKFKRVEDKNLTRFDLYRYLDVMFKDLDGYVTLTVSKEANDTTTNTAKTFVVGNTGTSPSPFVKKRVSMLQKGQAILIQFSNNKLNETFTICQFSLTGTQDSPRLYKLSKIISM